MRFFCKYMRNTIRHISLRMKYLANYQIFRMLSSLQVLLFCRNNNINKRKLILFRKIAEKYIFVKKSRASQEVRKNTNARIS
jgi:hypothetical protein